MTTPDLSRKVRQLDNDVQSIYEILARVELTQGRHTNRFNEMAQDLDGLRTKVDAHDARFDAIDARFDAIDAKIDRVIALVSGERGPA